MVFFGQEWPLNAEKLVLYGQNMYSMNEAEENNVEYTDNIKKLTRATLEETKNVR